MRFELILSLLLAFVTLTMETNTSTYVVDVESQSSEEIYTYVEQMPQIIGGISELYYAIENKATNEEAHIQCEVLLAFTVLENGEIINPRSISTTTLACSHAALLAVENVNFKPGYHFGESVAVTKTLPLNFILEK